MNANELADINDWSCCAHVKQVSTMLRKQAQEIADLKISNQDLKYQLIQKAGEQVLNDFKELIDEDNDLFRKEQVEKFYAEARPLREKYKLCELTDEEIINTLNKICYEGDSGCVTGSVTIFHQTIVNFARAILKKASEK